MLFSFLPFFLFYYFIESSNKGVNQHSKYVTEVQQQRAESPTITLNWLACTETETRYINTQTWYRNHQRYILNFYIFISFSIFSIFIEMNSLCTPNSIVKFNGIAHHQWLSPGALFSTFRVEAHNKCL